MKIAVNTRLLLKDKMEGIGWFAYETLSRITRNHPEVEFTFIFDRPYHSDFIFSENVKPVVMPPQARHPFLYAIWFNLSVESLLRKLKPDLYLSPDGYIPLWTKTKTLPVFHDLNFEHYPEDLPYLERKYYKTFFPKYAHKSSRLATVSEFSKKDIIEKYGLSPDKIDVLCNGANPAFVPLDEKEQQTTREKFAHAKPYFLFVGALHPRKNLVNLFKAFEIFKEKTGLPHQLVLVGNQKWWTKPIREAFEGNRFKEEILLQGRQPFEQLQKIVASAEAQAYVSYFEGFGIPIVEAFRCNTPVITSNITSMPEVAGDAAMLCDPFNPQEIADSMETIATQKAKRQTLIEKGKKRAELFTWDIAAEKLWQSITQTIQS